MSNVMHCSYWSFIWSVKVKSGKKNIALFLLKRIFFPESSIVPECWPCPAACSREKASLQMQKECLSPPLKSMLLFLAHFIADVAEVREGCGDEGSKCLSSLCFGKSCGRVHLSQVRDLWTAFFQSLERSCYFTYVKMTIRQIKLKCTEFSCCQKL